MQVDQTPSRRTPSRHAPAQARKASDVTNAEMLLMLGNDVEYAKVDA